jgi:hypothetical protein
VEAQETLSTQNNREKKEQCWKYCNILDAIVIGFQLQYSQELLAQAYNSTYSRRWRQKNHKFKASQDDQQDHVSKPKLKQKTRSVPQVVMHLFPYQLWFNFCCQSEEAA